MFNKYISWTLLRLSFNFFAERLHFSGDYVTELEKGIDEMTTELPALTNFILPVSSVVQ